MQKLKMTGLQLWQPLGKCPKCFDKQPKDDTFSNA